MNFSESESRRLPAASRQRTVIFSIAVTAAFTLGIYSLVLAFANAGKVAPLDTDGLIRTATAADKEKIETALGSPTGPDLVYVVVDPPLSPPDANLRQATQQAAQNLLDSGLVISVRHLEPIDSDYAIIVEQNSIVHFPAVLVVKRNGGIILITENMSSENLLEAYHTVWGKKSDCGSDRNAVY